MKYNIQINQEALSKTNLDIIDGAILDYLYVYCNSRNEKINKQRIKDEKGDWTWINYQTLLQDMPLLKIKSSGALTPRIKKIEAAGYIETFRKGNRKLFIRMNEKIDELFIKNSKSTRTVHTDKQELFTQVNSNCSFKRTNNITIDNNINIYNQQSKDCVDNNQHSSCQDKKEIKDINTKSLFLGEIKPLFLEMLDKYRQVEYYAFDYVKEIAIVKRWIKQVKEKQPDWGEEEIAPRLKSYIKHWFEAHDNDPPSISRIFSSNSLNEYRFWVAKTHPSQINTSL